MTFPRTIQFATALWLASVSLAAAQTRFAAVLDASQVVNNVSESTATGLALFELNAARTHLSYSLQLNGLDLEPDPALRNDPNDVVAIHLHLHVPDVIGPHILNIFGSPSEDDDDLVVDFENDKLTGVYDYSDSLDPATGLPYFQDLPLVTKEIGDWLDELERGELYIAVHSRDRATNAAPGVDIRGNIFTVPEPAAASLVVVAALTVALRRRG